MPINPNLLRPQQIDFTPILEGLQTGEQIRTQRLANRLADLKAQQETGAQEFFQNLMGGQVQPPTPEQVSGPEGVVLPDVAEPVSTQGPLQGIDWFQLAQDPRVQLNPVLAERVNQMANLQATAMNARSNAAKSAFEASKYEAELATQQELEQQIRASGHPNAPQLIRLSKSGTPEAQTLIAEALENPKTSLAQLRKNIVGGAGSTKEKNIAELLESGQAKTRMEAERLIKEQDVRAAHDTRLKAIEEYMGPRALDSAGFQYMVRGTAPGAGFSGILPVISKNAEKWMTKLGYMDSEGRLSPKLLSARADTQGLESSIQMLRKGETAIQTFEETITASLPRMKELHAKVPNEDWPQLARLIQNYALDWLSTGQAPIVQKQFSNPITEEYMRTMMSSISGAMGRPGDAQTRHEIQAFLSPNMSAKAFKKILGNIDFELKARRNAYTRSVKDKYDKLDSIWGKDASRLFEEIPLPKDEEINNIGRSSIDLEDVLRNSLTGAP